MKGRHTRYNTDYFDARSRHSSASPRAHQSWLKGTSGTSGGEDMKDVHSPFSEPGQTNSSYNGIGHFLAYVQLARTYPATMRIPGEKMQAGESADNITSHSLSGKNKETAERGCDTIVLKNGDIVGARVAEIGQREIRYRRCEDCEGPVVVISISEVFMIKYPNGTRDYFNFETGSAPAETGTAKKKTDGMAIAGFSGSLVGLFIVGIPLGIMAMVFGFVSLGKLKKHPERYKGRGFAIASIIIGLIDIVGAAIVISNM